MTHVDAQPEGGAQVDGSTRQVTVILEGEDGPVEGVTPNSVVANNAAARPQGDVLDANAGTSPNASGSQGNFNVYECGASDADGVSTCTFSDPSTSPPGTDTVVFYVNQAAGGTAGPDAGEPQDAAQITWLAPRPS